MGLAIGLAFCFLVIGHIRHEYSFDRFHKKRSQIYYIRDDYITKGFWTNTAKVMAPLGPAILNEIPEVRDIAQLREKRLSEIIFKSDTLAVDHLYFATPGFLRLFDFPLMYGLENLVLETPYSVVVSKKTADLLFPGQYPVGKTIDVNDQFTGTITGVMYDFPSNTQLQCDVLVSHSTLVSIGGDVTSWDKFQDITFILLTENAHSEALPIVWTVWGTF